MTAVKEIAASPCATCPWLAKNQTAEARKNSPRAAGEKRRWYDVANLRRLWRGYQTGHPTLCHSTDPESATYGACALPPAGHERICVGGLILVARALETVNARSKAATKTPWAGLFTRNGMVYWFETLQFRGTALGVSKATMPIVYDADAVREVRVPWPDKILNDGAVEAL
jgi:hypothetical protein